MEDYSGTYCGVITEPKQFSWYNTWKRRLPSNPLKWYDYLKKIYTDKPKELESLDRVFNFAVRHYLVNGEDATYGATHYLTLELYRSGKIDWANKATVVAIIGNHVFLKDVP